MFNCFFNISFCSSNNLFRLLSASFSLSFLFSSSLSFLFSSFSLSISACLLSSFFDLEVFVSFVEFFILEFDFLFDIVFFEILVKVIADVLKRLDALVLEFFRWIQQILNN